MGAATWRVSRPISGGVDDDLRPRDQERDGNRRIRPAALSRRRGRAGRPHRDDRAHPGRRPRGDRRRGPGRRARLRRRPHPHGRAGLLGSARHLVVLARHHQRGDGQLRLHPGALRRGGQAHGRAQSAARRGHLGRGHGGGHQVGLDHLPRVPRLPRRPAEGHQLRRVHRPLRAPHLRDGRARLRAEGERGRSPRDGARAARRPARRRPRLHDLALAGPRDARRAAGGEPRRELGRGAAARRRHGRPERRHLRARR